MLCANDLKRVTWQCVHYTTAQDIELLIHDLQQAEIAVLKENVGSVATDADLLARMAKAMQFPPYFGQNWDALDECLADMTWLPAKGYVLVLDQADALWKRAAPTAGRLVESWLVSAEAWAEENIPFHLVFTWPKGEEVGRGGHARPSPSSP